MDGLESVDRYCRQTLSFSPLYAAQSRFAALYNYDIDLDNRVINDDYSEIKPGNSLMVYVSFARNLGISLQLLDLQTHTHPSIKGAPISLATFATAVSGRRMITSVDLIGKY